MTNITNQITRENLNNITSTLTKKSQPQVPVVSIRPKPPEKSSEKKITIKATDWKKNLIESIEKGDIDGLNKIPSIVYKELEYLPVNYAMQQKKAEIASLFIYRGSAVSEHAAFLAIKQDCLKVLSAYLRNKPEERKIPENWLPEASNHSSLPIIKLLIDHKAELPKNSLIKDSIDIIPLLLENGYSFNERQLERTKFKENAILLLKHGVPVSDYALSTAIINGWDDLVGKHLSRREKFSARDLSFAIKNRNYPLINKIMQLPNAPMNSDTLYYAVKINDKQLVQKLIDLDVPVPDEKNLFENADEGMLNLLLSKKSMAAKLLLNAVKYGDITIVKRLLENGAKVNKKAIELSFKEDSMDFFNLLLPLYKQDLLQDVASHCCLFEIDDQMASKYFKKLQERGVKPSIIILMFALCWKKAKFAKELIDLGVLNDKEYENQVKNIIHPLILTVIDHPEFFELAKTMDITLKLNITRQYPSNKLLDSLADFLIWKLQNKNPKRFSTFSKEKSKKLLRFLRRMESDIPAHRNNEDLVLLIDKSYDTLEASDPANKLTIETIFLEKHISGRKAWNWLFPKFDVPSAITKYFPYGFNLKLYCEILEGVKDLCKAYGEKGTNQELSAYKLSIVFESKQMALQYLQNFKKKHTHVRHPVHDATLLEVPRKEYWDTHLWRSILKKNKYKKKWLQIFALAPRIEKNLYGKFPSYPKVVHHVETTTKASEGQKFQRGLFNRYRQELFNIVRKDPVFSQKLQKILQQKKTEK